MLYYILNAEFCPLLLLKVIIESENENKNISVSHFSQTCVLNGLAVVFVRRVHTVVVKLPPLLCALPGALVLLWNKKQSNNESMNEWAQCTEPPYPHLYDSTYHHFPLRRSSQTHFFSLHETLSVFRLRLRSASAQLHTGGQD